MRKFYCFLAFLFALFTLFSCQKRYTERETTLDEKAEPYELFSFQRSYPDRDFDWKGWRHAIVAARKTAAPPVGERGSGGCTPISAGWTLQGPGNIAGRINAIAVHPNDENTVLVGFAGGGIFKTTDGTSNWHPVFDGQADLAIGDITYDPTNPQIVYAGTGDPNMPSIVFNGNGVYKSSDGGETWNYLGLEQQGIISKILVNPAQPNVLYAATMGNPYVRDAERGVYKSTDGGQSWTKSLFISDQAGASDLVMAPDDPQVLYASFWDRIRNNHESIIYGTHAQIYKTIDGGATWNLLGGGLPTGVMGRTGLVISPTTPGKLYAVFVDSLSTPGGLYKTTDGGQNWTSLNITALENAYIDFGWYFGKIRLNPTNDEDLYFLGLLLWQRLANGSWVVAAGAHSDCHDLAFCPSGRRYLATDGGIYRNNPNQTLWSRAKNLPSTQFYHVNINPHDTDNYWGGAQDNGIMKGNAGTYNNWASVFAADGFRSAFNPGDPAEYWVETQNGTIHQTIDDAANWTHAAACFGTTDRCNWDAPFFLSSYATDRFYAATFRVLTSSSGMSWGSISPDLTDGLIYEPRFHNISCLSESPLVDGKLFAGTSDGNTWWRQPNGDWFNISAGLPDRYVTSVYGSPTAPNRIFVTHSGYRDNEHTPHVHRSDDNGQHWTDLSVNLPEVPVNDLLVLPGHLDTVLFAATDAGVYVTADAGVSWQRLGANLPFVPVFDLEENTARKEIVAATYARSLWTFSLDSLFAQLGPTLSTLSGAIKTDLGLGVGQVLVEPNTTDTTGAYSLTLPACLPHTVRPYRNDQPLNGVTTFDLSLISKYILALQPITSPFRLIAADANRSGSITTFDIVQLRRLVLGLDTAFTNNTSWRFVPAGYVFPDSLNPSMPPFPDTVIVDMQGMPVGNTDFIAIKVGDINGSVDPTLQGPGEERWAADWPLYFRSADFQAGEIVMADFSGETIDKPGLQFSLQFDPEVLRIERVEPLLPGLSLDHFALNHLAEGKLALAFDNAFANKLSANSMAQPLFRVVLRARRGGSLAANMRLGNNPTLAAAYREDGTPLRPVLTPADQLATGSEASISPNPFGAAGAWLNLPVLPDGESLMLQLFDAQGKMVVEKKVMAEEARYPVHLPAGLFPANGVYLFKVKTEREAFSGKMVFQR